MPSLIYSQQFEDENLYIRPRQRKYSEVQALSYAAASHTVSTLVHLGSLWNISTCNLAKAPIKQNTYSASKLPQQSAHTYHSTAIPKYSKHTEFVADLCVCSGNTGISHHLLFLYNIKQLEFPTAVWAPMDSTTLLRWSILLCFRAVLMGRSLAVRGRCSCVSTVGPVAGHHSVPVLLPLLLPGTTQLLQDALSAAQRRAQALSCLVSCDGIFNILLNWFVLGKRNRGAGIQW